MPKKLLRKLIFGSFCVSGAVIIVGFFWRFPGLFYLELILPFLSVVMHAAWRWGARRTVGLALAAMAIGWLAEFSGLRFGVLFGGHYLYNNLGPVVAGVPLAVMAYWFVFMYTADCLTGETGIISGALIDAILMVAIDLFLDPVMTKAGFWRWLEGGAYFGIPAGNFFGWFLTALAIGLVFRLVAKPVSDDRLLSFIPTLGYLLIMFGLLGSALNLGRTDIAITGVLFMGLPLGLLALLRQASR
jgi:putative membrane protein